MAVTEDLKINEQKMQFDGPKNLCFPRTKWFSGWKETKKNGLVEEVKSIDPLTFTRSPPTRRKIYAAS